MMTDQHEMNANALAENHKKQLERMLADRFICQTIGIKLVEAGVGKAIAELTIESKHLNGVGLCQGGVLFSLADYAWAAASNYNEESVVSLDVSISYCRSATSGRLVAEAREINRTRSTTVGDVVVRDEQGRTICLARARGYVLQPR
ncbi:MAG: PaaI family thioesterase [Thermoguttaceae bacterium]|nr:PaaI family thioesterase [Thermoguttaceae bacterium]